MADGTPTDAWESRHRERTPIFERLAEEVEFVLRSKAAALNIKTHSVSSRVKTTESITEKVHRKELGDPLAELDDLVGARVVVLFLSDLPRLDALIRETFEIHGTDDKIAEGDPASFGYMSVHYVATLGDDHSGARYDDLKEIRFEIQMRTVVMDAWANVSHYLDYKGESSVPDDLQRDFFALSGLFYVADQHFEMFAQRSRESQQRADEEVSREPGEVQINLDTMEAYLRQRYPDRRRSGRAAISDLVEEIVAAGYGDLGALDSALEQGESAFAGYEPQYPPAAGDRRFADVGVVRITLALVDKTFAQETYDELDIDPVAKLALWA